MSTLDIWLPTVSDIPNVAGHATPTTTLAALLLVVIILIVVRAVHFPFLFPSSSLWDLAVGLVMSCSCLVLSKLTPKLVYYAKVTKTSCHQTPSLDTPHHKTRLFTCCFSVFQPPTAVSIITRCLTYHD